MPTLRNVFSSALCTGFLIGGVPGFAAAQVETPAPTTPATSPATPAVPTTPTGTTVMTAHTVLVDPTTAAATATARATGKDWSQIYLMSNTKTLPDKRVSVDQKSAKIRDAVRDALDQAKIDYVLDADIPDDARVSVKMDNVKISTALDAITESAGLKWQAGVERAGSVTVRVGKNLPNNTNRSLSSYDVFVQNGESPNVFTYKTSPASKVVSPQITITPNASSAAPWPVYPGTSYTSIARSNETRSTFTCPNCHNQVTILRKNVEVKCPTCQRPFEAGWKVCPFDGTKRPIAKDDWRFCPICGKAIPDGVASLFSTPEEPSVGENRVLFPYQSTLPPNYYAYQPSLNFAPLTAPSLTLPAIKLPIIPPPPGDYK